MHQHLQKYFHQYPASVAPFMHQQAELWRQSRPLSGLKILHHVPVFPNTLLKISCLIEAGAEVTVTHPHPVCQANAEAILALNEAKIPYVDNLNQLNHQNYDIYYDCCALLYQSLGPPRLGVVELTGSGDQWYRQENLAVPVISIDQTRTKRLETFFGCAQSTDLAITQLTKVNAKKKTWLIFGFGKIGRGLAYFCHKHKIPVMIVDSDEKQREKAKNFKLTTIDPQNLKSLEYAIIKSDIILTATGKKNIMGIYPHAWFKEKILVNLGAEDEFGDSFARTAVLNEKRAINFVLKDPTHMIYIDPSFYLHNIAALALLENPDQGFYEADQSLDDTIIENWCHHHDQSLSIIEEWFEP